MTAIQGKLRVDAKHPRVTQELREQIASGRYSLGAQLPHRDDLEISLGASRATVQTALNTLLREGFLRSVSGQGTFVAERPPFTTDYGILFPVPAGEFHRFGFYAAIQSAANKILADRQGHVRSYCDVGGPIGEAYDQAVLDCASHQIAGLILAGVNFSLKDSSLLKHPADFPRVAVQGGPGGAFDGPCVYPDMMGFYRRAFERCVQAGRKRVAVLSCEARVELIHDLADKAGLYCPTGRVVAIPATWSLTCRSLVPLLFSLPRNERPDALVIADDNLVADATAGLLALGLKTPGDLTVIAHANLPLMPKSHVPCEFLAFDAGHVVQACIDCIDMQRLGKKPSPFTLINPVFMT